MNIRVRRATSDDQAAIVALVRSERLNPNGLHWQRFVVADDAAGRLIGAVQLRQHGDGGYELGSLVVTRPMRGLGTATRLIEALLMGHDGPMHMITVADHAQRYARWGFTPIEPAAAPGSVRRNHLLGRLARVISWIKGLPPRHLVILERASTR
jgi:amino-acid N-acetyltransferase